MTIGTVVGLPGAPGAAIGPEVRPRRARRRRSRLVRVLMVVGITLAVLVATVALYLGISLYRIDRAVHHVAIPASLLAKGHDDLLAVVKGPDHTEEIYAFHVVDGHTNVLSIPGRLQILGPGGRSAPLSSLSIHDPVAIIAGLARLGIPVGRYVGVDLHRVRADSNLGKLAQGKISVTSLISDPTGTASLMEQVAAHVYLGPHTPTSALLTLMKVPVGHPVSVPTSIDASGNMVLAAPFADVLRQYL